MSATATATETPTARLRPKREHLEVAAAWLLGFAPTTYLALSGGGYDVVARSEIAIVVWWILLLGAIVGVFPNRRFSVVAWIALALFGGFVAWTWIALGWTASKEQTLAELGRVAGYLGMLALGLALVSRRNVASLLAGLACAVGIVSLLAVLSRLVPSLFPADTAAQFYATSRLRYPFDYSDGVGEFAALGLPLLLFVATGGRTVVARALAAAGLPVVVLCLAMTVSRGGILAAVVGVVLFFALVPDRIPRLATGLVAALASAVVMLELLHLSGVRNEYVVAAPASQREAMLLVLALACLFVALVQAGLTWLGRRRARPRWLAVSRRAALAIAAGIAALVLVGVVVLFASGAAGRLWDQFKQPNPPAAGGSYFRLLSVAGSHRYQYWQAAVHAFKAHPWDGIGPGTFQFYWAQHNTLAEFVRNAHSLWIETLAELGIIGFVLIGGFFGLALVAGAVRGFRAPPATRLAIATAVAATAAFCAAAAFDWVWQIGVMPMIAMLLVSAALVGDDSPGSKRARIATRVALGVATLFALWAIAIPLASTIELRNSQAAVLRGDFRAALSDAATAQRIAPSAASPWLQRALILEQLNDIPGARNAIAEAAKREPVNWEIWLVASRLATEADQPRLALAYYQRAKALNPTSPILQG